MSLLLDALKKAEAQQQSRSADGVPEHLLQLEPLDRSADGSNSPLIQPTSPPATQHTNAQTSRNSAPRMHGSAPAASTPHAAATASQQIRFNQSMRSISTASGRRGFNIDTPPWLTFPVVVATVIVVGVVAGGTVLYREYTYMPSAITPPVGTTKPSRQVASNTLPETTATSANEQANELATEHTPPSTTNLAISPPNQFSQTPQPRTLPITEANPPTTPATTPPSNPTNATANAVTNTAAPLSIGTRPQIQPNLVPENKPAPAPTSAAKATVAPTQRNNVAIQRDIASTDSLAGQLQAGWQALQRGDGVTAQTHYQRALQFDQSNIDAWLGLGYAAQQEGRWQDAERYYRQALTLNPRDAYANSALANLRTFGQAPNTGNTSASEGTETRLKTLGQEASNQAELAALQFALGNQQAAQQRWAEAQQSYFKAVASDPRNAEYVFNLAVSLDQLRQTRQAFEHYQKALELARNQRTVRFDIKAAQARSAALQRSLQESNSTISP